MKWKINNAQSIPNGTEGLDLNLEISFEPLKQIVTRTIYALAKALKGRQINTVMVVALVAWLEGLANALMAPMSKILIDLPEDGAYGLSQNALKQFALPIGSALSALPIKVDQINFRQQEFSDPSPWKRLKKSFAIYFGLSIA